MSNPVTSQPGAVDPPTHPGDAQPPQPPPAPPAPPAQEPRTLVDAAMVTSPVAEGQKELEQEDEGSPVWGMCCMIFGYVTVIILSLVFLFGAIAAMGAAQLVLGNVILVASKLQHYATPSDAAKVGAVGSPIASIAFALLLFVFRSVKIDSHILSAVLTIAYSAASGAASGAIGFAVLSKHGAHLEPDPSVGGIVDIAHMTRAGALGGVILGPAVRVLVLMAQLLAFSFGRKKVDEEGGPQEPGQK